MIGRLTSRSLAAYVGVGFEARIKAAETDAGFVGGAIAVPCAFRVAPGEGVPEEVRRAGALGPVVDCLAVGVLTTNTPTTCGLTAVGLPVTRL